MCQIPHKYNSRPSSPEWDPAQSCLRLAPVCNGSSSPILRAIPVRLLIPKQPKELLQPRSGWVFDIALFEPRIALKAERPVADFECILGSQRDEGESGLSFARAIALRLTNEVISRIERKWLRIHCLAALPRSA